MKKKLFFGIMIVAIAALIGCPNGDDPDPDNPDPGPGNGTSFTTLRSTTITTDASLTDAPTRVITNVPSNLGTTLTTTPVSTTSVTANTSTPVTGFTSAALPNGATVYIFVDPLSVANTNVKLENLVFNRYNNQGNPGSGSDIISFDDHFFGDTEQGGTGNNNWRYVYRVNGGAWQDLIRYAEWGDNWQVSATPQDDDIYFSLHNWEGTTISSGIKDGDKYEVGIAYTVAQTRIRLPDFSARSHGAGLTDDPPGPVNVVINYVTSESSLEPVTVEGFTSAEIPNGTTVYVYVDPLTYAAGGHTNVIFDNLAFNRYTTGGQPGSGANNVYNVVGAYVNDTEQGGTGNANWRWVGRVDGGPWQDLYHWAPWDDNWRWQNDEGPVNASIFTWVGQVTIGSENFEGQKYEIGVAYTVNTTRVRLPDFTVISHGSDGIGSAASGPVNVVVEFTTSLNHAAMIQGVSNIQVAQDDFIYIWVDPLNYPNDGTITNVVLNNLVIDFNGTNYRPTDYYFPRAGTDTTLNVQGPIVYHVWRRNSLVDTADIGEWDNLNALYEPSWGDDAWTWRVSSTTTDPISFSIFAWPPHGTYVVGAGCLGNYSYDVGLAFKAPAAGTVNIPDFIATSWHADESTGWSPASALSDIAIKIGRYNEQ